MTMLIIPVMPNKEEAWRQLMQELQGSRGWAFRVWCRQLDLLVEQVWLNETAGGTAVVINLIIGDSKAALTRLPKLLTPFDHWFRQQILTLHGVDLMKITQVSTYLYFGEQLKTNEAHICSENDDES